ncbi:CRISPR-associated endonuclease Cas2 [Atopobium sp. oral taxon 199]|uniref:CRISPR-associated endonuclease Cas2 n=1 Tax=Atopobium sp. oral taxon 199 TaxID=712156 RepID=UPI00034E2C39|nr:CRISPR-associated endonuclease Cas2 [Atopobium sp. oral taxon 199]EPD77055.1 CRISPR-associated endoribonuclease cas2 [Atopobium sp. oral taxon 199 str. F0494]
MYVLVTYDVASGDVNGARRLRRVAKVCMQYGQRVQYSVFECLVDPSQYESMKHELVRIIDKEKDSLRFYNLGKQWKNRVDHVGAKSSYDPEGILCI